MSLTLTIDNRPVSGRAGETILQVAADHGIRIPTLCHLEGLSGDQALADFGVGAGDEYAVCEGGGNAHAAGSSTSSRLPSAPSARCCSSTACST